MCKPKSYNFNPCKRQRISPQLSKGVIIISGCLLTPPTLFKLDNHMHILCFQPACCVACNNKIISMEDTEQALVLNEILTDDIVKETMVRSLVHLVGLHK